MSELHRPPSALGQLLGQSRALTSRGRLTWHCWRRVVGARVAQKSRPHTVFNRVLTVIVTSATWSQELSFLKPMILERLLAEGFAIDDLRFRVGEVQPPQRQKPTRVPPRRRLPDSLGLALSRIDDPELRGAIAEAAAYGR